MSTKLCMNDMQDIVIFILPSMTLIFFEQVYVADESQNCERTRIV